jgi:signal transduction histidine kinase/uncharacterized protein YigA (DUF484 family)
MSLSRSDEIDIIFATSNRLTQVSTPIEWIEAVSGYARERGADAAMLYWLIFDADGSVEWLETGGIWLSSGETVEPVPERYSASDHRTFIQNWMSTPRSPTLIADVSTSELLDTATRELYFTKGIRSSAILPLATKGRWIGVLIFGWSKPQRFNDSDQRIYSALIQHATPVIDSLRLVEQSLKRADDLENASQEIDILYTVSSKIAHAASPQEVLDVISIYAREHGADHCRMVYFYGDSEPYKGVITAEWTADWKSAYGHVALFDGYGSEQDAAARQWMAHPDHPWLVEDAAESAALPQPVRERMRQNGERGFALLPLNNQGRWIGIVTFSWSQPYRFTERDRRIYSALIQQTAPVVDALRLIEENRTRAYRAELLLKINQAISKAKDEPQILAAIGQYVQPLKARRIMLNYIDPDDKEPFTIQRSVAMWEDGETDFFDPRRHSIIRLQRFGYFDLWYPYPDRVLLIENLAEDERIAPDMRQQMLEVIPSRAMATFPLFTGGRCIGVLTIGWFEPHVFSDEERYIYSNLLQTLPSVFASRRAYLVEEEARRENEFLYQLGEEINAARTFDEVIQAVSRIDAYSESVILSIWEDYDFEDAAYREVVAVLTRESQHLQSIGMRIPIELTPAVRHMPRGDIWVSENTQIDPQIDPVTANYCRDMGILAFITMPLNINNRWVGIISFQSSSPRRFTPREIRLANGIGDLVAAAVERIRLQMETEASRQRAEWLAKINAALSQAHDEDSILSAVASLAERYGAALSMLAYVNAGEAETFHIVGLRSSDGSSPLPPSLIPIAAFPIENYPILRLALSGQSGIILIEDTVADQRLQDEAMQSFLRVVGWGASILVPLLSAEQLQGILTFAWKDPQQFPRDMRYLLAALMPTASSVIARRRAYLAEQDARRESELLYRASEAINAANSLEEIVAAIAIMNLGNRGVTLNVFENFDYDTAHYVEIVASSETGPRGMRWPVNAWPALKTMPRQGLFFHEDIANEPGTDESIRHSYLQSGVRSILGISLSLDNHWMGTIGIRDSKVRSYTPREKRLVAGIGDLAVAALDRIRLKMATETARLRAEQLVKVNTALSQAASEGEIVTAIALYSAQEKPRHITLYYLEVDDHNQPEMAVLQAYWENGKLHLDEPDMRTPILASDFNLMPIWQANPDSPVFIEDLLTDERLSAEKRRDIARLPTRSLVLLPLQSEGRWQGILLVEWSQHHRFSADERYIYTALLQSLAPVVAKGRAYHAERQARREAELLYRASEAINASQTIPEIGTALSKLEFARTRITLAIFENYDYEDAAEINLLNLLPDQDCTYAERLPLASTALARVIPRSGLSAITDVRQAPELDAATRASLIDDGIYATLSVSLGIGSRWMGGVIFTESHPRGFTPHEKRLAVGIADLVAAAIERMRLVDIMEAARRRAESYAEQAQSMASLEERNRLARELHDSVSQALYGIVLGARTARALLDRDPSRLQEPLDYILALADAGLTEMRALIFELRPESLENDGLVIALQKQATALQARYQLKVITEFCGEPTIPLETKESIYRIAREALHNTVKHARASEIRLEIFCENNQLILIIADNGVGFDTSGRFPGHLGLQSMRERATRLNGTLTLESAPNKGTRIRVAVPVTLGPPEPVAKLVEPG